MGWVGLFVLAGIGIWVYVLIIQSIEDREFRKNVAERQRLERQGHDTQQGFIYVQLAALCTRSFSAFEAMPTHLLNAETLLDQAEVDFKERAFAPFWDAIQKAAMQLGRFNDGVRQIANDLTEHSALAKEFDSTPPRFPIVVDSVRGMAAANTTTNRFRAVVRKAQCDFQFAKIYEQRMTNQLLVAGFQNLAQAIDGLGDRITSSIHDLSNEISGSSSALNESMAGLRTSVEELHSTTRQEASDQVERHSKALAMLGNIQRRRIP